MTFLGPVLEVLNTSVDNGRASVASVFVQGDLKVQY
jgi:hypothetical protein